MDPLAAVVALLRPRAVLSKMVTGAGRWGVRYVEDGGAGFGLVLAGECYISVGGREPRRLSRGDFALVPASLGFTMTSHPDVEPVAFRVEPGERKGMALRHGDVDGEPDVRVLGGAFHFEPANLSLLVDLLPAVVHIAAADTTAGRLGQMIELITDEALGQRPGRELIVERLAEILLVEALRSEAVGALSRPGLLQGLADPQLARALRSLHAEPARDWTVAEFARQAGLSRSTFSERFAETVGSPPMEYLIQWRMALAKDLLRREAPPLETVALRIGYQSASAFSTAFRRYVGHAPGQFAKRDHLARVGEPA